MRDWTIRGPVTCRNVATGEDHTYDSFQDFVNNRGHNLRGGFGDESCLNKVGDGYSFIHWYRHLLLDENGLIIPIWKIEELYQQHPNPRRNPHLGGRWGIWKSGHYEYRRDPVPGTSCGWAGGHWYKHPQTMSEKRAAIALESDEDAREYNIRPRRSRPNIPDAYWDRPRADERTRKSWKKHRRTQWRAK